MKVERKYDPEFSIYVPLEEWLEFPREEIEATSEFINDYCDNLVRCAGYRFDLARWLTWEKQTPEIAKESTNALVHAAKMLAGFHQIAQTPEQKHTISIEGLPEVIWSGEGILESGRIHPARWSEAYFCAAITRDQLSMDILANFPIAIMKKSATTALPVSYTLIEVFQSYHHKQADFPVKLQKAFQQLKEDGDDWCLSIGMGYMEVFAALTTDIGFDFNEVLAKNVAYQEKYWMNEMDDGVVPVDSFLPIELLGMACMYHDKGHQVSVESDSLPLFLIEGVYL